MASATKKRVKTGGRKAGTPNHLTGDLKAMIRGALDELGGQAWLVEKAREDWRPFIGLLGKIVPHEIVGEGGGPVVTKVEVEFVSPG